MNTQTVSTGSAAKLAAAGFPQPAPAPGQWWNIKSEFVFISEKTASYFTVVRYVPGTRPLVDEYFDAEDFNGLVFLPTVGDILRELPGYDIGYYTALEGNPAFVVFDDYGERAAGSQHPAEAAALAWLEMNKG